MEANNANIAPKTITDTSKINKLLDELINDDDSDTESSLKRPRDIDKTQLEQNSHLRNPEIVSLLTILHNAHTKIPHSTSRIQF